MNNTNVKENVYTYKRRNRKNKIIEINLKYISLSLYENWQSVKSAAVVSIININP